MTILTLLKIEITNDKQLNNIIKYELCIQRNRSNL